MLTVPSDLRHRLHKYHQEHVLAWWEQMNDAERQGLIEQLENIDLDELRSLYAQREATVRLPAFERIQPIPVVEKDVEAPEARKLGEELLARGEVAALVVAGGQGSRLGFEHPKGMFAIGPVSQKSLFQIHAEKILARSRRHGKVIPFLVMTSPTNHEETTSFFQQHSYFGLPRDEVYFFSQGTMPALDWSTGQLLMESKSRLFTSPNGHGGSLTALAETGLLDRLLSRGIRQIFYFQVDNPLVKVCDPDFLGQHAKARAEVSTKVVPKLGPEDKLGNLVMIGGHCSMIEYSDLPKELGQQADAQGRLRFWVGNTAIHLFDVEFLGRVTRGKTRIPFHVARKKVPHINHEGEPVKPTEENALKFEMFIFDVLPRADRWTVVETSRPEEFEPLKNATGPDSPETVHQAMSDLSADWLARAGIAAPRRPDGHAAVAIEISPLVALDAEELAGKVDRALAITGPTYLQ